MSNDAARSLVNTIKERPELLRNLNVAIARVMDEAGIDPGELRPDEILEIVTEWLRDSKEEIAE